MKGQLYGKTVVSIISGGNSDAFRMSEILERSLIYGNKRHYFKIEFPQKPGTLKDFVIKILGHHDDIFYFRYTKVINKEHGPVIVGIEVKDPNDIISIKNNMTNLGFKFEKISNVDLF
jgi:threonine dehydratase